MDLQNLRREYRLKTLQRKELKQNPFDQFHTWFEEAVQAQVEEPNAMALATVSSEGKPSCRMVLMKQFDASGLVFFTNLNSRKGVELKTTPFASAVLFWKELERQVIIEGEAEEASREVVRTYFSSRPRRSQLSAAASRQDAIIPSRKALEDAFEEEATRYEDREIPLPDHWGGFRIRPHRFEFWQGRPDRVHDRFQYVLISNQWTIDRLSP